MTIRSLRTETLDVAYLEEGPPDGQPVLLLHGFPDDATSYAQVMKELGRKGFRALAPFGRGVGPTRFLDDATPRAGDHAAIGQDALDFVDGLDLRDVIVVGQDWGSPTSEVVSAMRPERVARLVKLNWYGVYSMAEQARAKAFAYGQLEALWYVWILNLELGAMVLERDRAGLAAALWKLWSPSWSPPARDAALRAVLPSFDNPDFARVVLSAYRSHITASEQDPRHDALRASLAKTPPVTRPTVVMPGADDGVERTPLSDEARLRYFTGPFVHEVLPGVGHFPHREAPAHVIRAIEMDIPA